MTFTHRQELELIAQRVGGASALEKLKMPEVPPIYHYAWDKFWDIYSMFGQYFTVADILIYHKLFAPSMARIDMRTIIRMRTAMQAQITKLVDENKPKSKDEALNQS